MNKPWYQSKTYHGLAVILIGIAFGYFGEELTPDMELQISETVSGLLGLLGVILAAIGRNKADGGITLTKE